MGSIGAAVTELQTALEDLGYDIELTGHYDDAIVAAVREFQADRSL